MVSTRGVKRRRANPADSEGVSETIAVSVPEESSTAQPSSKRAATSSVGFEHTLADEADSDNDFGEALDLDDLDGEDSDFKEDVILGDLDEEDEDLSEQAIHEARLAGELAIDDEDAEDEEGDEEEGLHDVLSEKDENATEFLQINPELVDQANVERFLARLRNMIVSLIALVNSIDGNSFFGTAYSAGRAAGLLPVTRVWWQLLIKVDPEYLMELYSNTISI
ncbi:MAG: hypothetical protein Q9197_004591 [Variospora fuerteventurae]